VSFITGEDHSFDNILFTTTRLTMPCRLRNRVSFPVEYISVACIRISRIDNRDRLTRHVNSYQDELDILVDYCEIHAGLLFISFEI
jgi:hypothetical protein